MFWEAAIAGHLGMSFGAQARKPSALLRIPFSGGHGSLSSCCKTLGGLGWGLNEAGTRHSMPLCVWVGGGAGLGYIVLDLLTWLFPKYGTTSSTADPAPRLSRRLASSGGCLLEGSVVVGSGVRWGSLGEVGKDCIHICNFDRHGLSILDAPKVRQNFPHHYWGWV